MVLLFLLANVLVRFLNVKNDKIPQTKALLHIIEDQVNVVYSLFLHFERTFIIIRQTAKH